MPIATTINYKYAKEWHQPCVCVSDAGIVALDQVVQTHAEGKADVQDLLMEYCKMKKPL